MSEPFIVEGYLNLVCQEGGYAGPDWEIDGHDLPTLLQKHFGVEPIHYDTPDWNKLPHNTVPGDIPIGRVRITVERVL